MPNDPQAKIMMICTGTGRRRSARFTMRRQRTCAGQVRRHDLVLRRAHPESLPYFGPLKKVPDALLRKHLVFSRSPAHPRNMSRIACARSESHIAGMLRGENSYIYICGLKGMESGVEQAFMEIAAEAGLDWAAIRQSLREEGRYHVETY